MHAQSLELQLLRSFPKNRDVLIGQKIVSKLIKNDFTIEEIFNARFTQPFLQNLTNRQVFNQVFNTLEIIYFEKHKPSNKKQGKSILNNPRLLKYALQLVFTEGQKKIIDEQLKKEFQPASDSTQPEQKPLALLLQLLKTIFEIPQDDQEDKAGEDWAQPAEEQGMDIENKGQMLLENSFGDDW